MARNLFDCDEFQCGTSFSRVSESGSSDNETGGVSIQSESDMSDVDLDNMVSDEDNWEPSLVRNTESGNSSSDSSISSDNDNDNQDVRGVSDEEEADVIMGKNNVTEWSSKPFEEIRPRARNIVKLPLNRTPNTAHVRTQKIHFCFIWTIK